MNPIQVIFNAVRFIGEPFETFVPESPRWLFAKHRMEELYDILEKAAKVNGIKLDHLESLKGLLQYSMVQNNPEFRLKYWTTTGGPPVHLLACIVHSFA